MVPGCSSRSAELSGLASAAASKGLPGGKRLSIAALTPFRLTQGRGGGVLRPLVRRQTHYHRVPACASGWPHTFRPTLHCLCCMPSAYRRWFRSQRHCIGFNGRLSAVASATAAPPNPQPEWPPSRPGQEKSIARSAGSSHNPIDTARWRASIQQPQSERAGRPIRIFPLSWPCSPAQGGSGPPKTAPQ